MQIVVIAGSNREEACSRALARALFERYESRPEIKATLLDLAELPLELLAPSAYANKPEAFARFAEAVLAADGLHVVTPEYNGGMPGVLKLFIDHLPFPAAFERRPVCFTGVAAGRWGALRPIEQLQAVFGYRNAYQLPERVFIDGVGRALGDDGWPKEEALAQRLERQMAHFVDYCKALRPLRK